MFRWIGKSENGKTVTLHHIENCKISFPPNVTPAWIKANSEIIRVATVLDVETTGLNQTEDSIIEIGLRQFLFNKNTGEVLVLGKGYSNFQDPGKPISAEIQNLTGITDAMVQGQQIDWSLVDNILSESHLIIAHNAKFDRPFIDRRSNVSKDKVWACSHKQIDWSAKGFTSSKLELLNIYHGFFTDSHRAMNDVDALVYLLSLPEESSKSPYLLELLSNARRPMTHVIATGAPFDAKDHLKSRFYTWDNINRFWSKVIFKDELKDEITWQEEIVYCGPFGGMTRDIALTDNFKN